jgi:hypothetical protein
VTGGEEPPDSWQGQFGLVYRLLVGTWGRGKREAISLAPWLQPGDQVYKMIPEPFPTVSPASLQTKPLETVPCQFRFAITGLKPRC